MLNWISNEIASIPSGIGILLGIALIVSALGFYRTVYFISVGYAFAITGMAVAAVIIGLASSNFGLVPASQNIGLFLWSVRLGIYLLQRERQTKYRQAAEQTYQSTAGVKLGVKFAIWISVSLLYVAMFSPSLFRLSGTDAPTAFSSVTQFLGLIIMFGGLILEAVADKQKADFKSQHPKEFCNVGTYRWVRCPNYLGEILFWLGNWVIAVTFYTSALQWVVSLVGLVCITLIMIGSTKRLERSQAERYGSQLDYQTYIQSIPVLFPFVPVYTLKNIRVYLE